MWHGKLMQRFFVTLLIGLCVLISACSGGNSNNNANFRQCSVNTMQGECLTTLDNLIPGQSNVGRYVIEMEDGTLDKFIAKCNDGKLEEDLFKRGSDYANTEDGGNIGVVMPQGIAGVIAPDGKIMLYNGHHHSFALNELYQLVKAGLLPNCNYNKQVYVYIADNYYNSKYNSSDGSLENAYKYMIKNLIFEERVWLKDSNYQPIPYTQLPGTLSDMGNDPYRSLIKLVADNKCNKGSKKDPDFIYQQLVNPDSVQPFVEFSWGERLRDMKISELGYDPYQNFPYDYDPKTGSCLTKSKKVCKDIAKNLTKEAYNYILGRYYEFRGLPGYNYKPINTEYTCQ